jgi:hypothetical protein
MDRHPIRAINWIGMTEGPRRTRACGETPTAREPRGTREHDEASRPTQARLCSADVALWRRRIPARRFFRDQDPHRSWQDAREPSTQHPTAPTDCPQHPGAVQTPVAHRCGADETLVYMADRLGRNRPSSRGARIRVVTPRDRAATLRGAVRKMLPRLNTVTEPGTSTPSVLWFDPTPRPPGVTAWGPC